MRSTIFGPGPGPGLADITAALHLITPVRRNLDQLELLRDGDRAEAGHVVARLSAGKKRVTSRKRA
jgi:hypothetical protein